MHTTKEKGDIGLTQIIAALTLQQVAVALPISEHLPYDLIAEKNGLMKRTQARYAQLKNGKIEVKLTTSWSNSSGTHTRYRNKTDFDLLAVYCPDLNRCFIIPSEEFDNVRSVSLRITKPKTLNKANKCKIRYAENFICWDDLWKATQIGEEAGLLNQ